MTNIIKEILLLLIFNFCLSRQFFRVNQN